ncbi:MAG: Hsp20/alpha crystallin family protein [Candidatus Pacebacteria bacterium]|nr:Hsp20/alpha crystallin family protein [Candidatus Paceibacterota bacterium]
MKEKRSLFERLTGSISVDDDFEDEEETEEQEPARSIKFPPAKKGKQSNLPNPSSIATWMEEESGEGQLSVDVYETPTEIVIKTMVAGVKREDLDISLTRDMVTIKGKREEEHDVSEDNYVHKELYWGSFSRSILLPHEVEIEEAEATENLGMLTIRLPKVDKERQTKLKVMKAI